MTDNLFEQAIHTQRLGENIGEMRAKIAVQEWLIKWGKHIPVVAFAELRAILNAPHDEQAEADQEATRAAHSYTE